MRFFSLSLCVCVCVYDDLFLSRCTLFERVKADMYRRGGYVVEQIGGNR